MQFSQVSFSIQDESFRRFENFTVKLSAKERNWTLFEVRTHPALLDTLISKYDIGPVKLPGLSRNGPLVVMLIVFGRISNLLSTHTGKTHIWKGVAGNLESS